MRALLATTLVVASGCGAADEPVTRGLADAVDRVGEKVLDLLPLLGAAQVGGGGDDEVHHDRRVLVPSLTSARELYFMNSSS